MAFQSIKDKLTNIAGGEILGEADADQSIYENEVSSKPKIEKKKKPISSKMQSKPEKKQKPIKQKPIKQNKINKVNTLKVNKRRNTVIRDEDPISEVNSVKLDILSSVNEDEKSNEISISTDTMDGYEDVLSFLGIKENLDPDVDFKSNQLDYVEFTQTTPLGFDFDEVTDFISRAKYSMHKLESALMQRDIDVVKLASEVKKVEQKMIEKNQERELERMIGGQTEEERLIEENMELKIDINDLKRKLKGLSNDSRSNGDLSKELEILRAENDILKMSSISNLNKNDATNILPTFNDIHEDCEEEMDVDMFGSMLDDIGGLYDE